MRLIDADALKTPIEDRIDNIPASDYDNGWNNAIYAVIDEIDNAPTVKTYETFSYEKGFQDGKYSAEMERLHNEWNNHTVACLLADLFGDPCACNHCGIDEWLPKKCDFANKECPDVVGVACWEQFLKHRKGGAT